MLKAPPDNQTWMTEGMVQVQRSAMKLHEISLEREEFIRAYRIILAHCGGKGAGQVEFLKTLCTFANAEQTAIKEYREGMDIYLNHCANMDRRTRDTAIPE